MRLAEERDLVSHEELFPAIANEFMLGGNNVQQIFERGRWDFVGVAGNNASPLPGKPDLGRACAWNAFANMNVNGLITFIRPEEHAVAADGKQARQP